MREVELKSVVDDIAKRRALIEKAGGHITFEGKLRDVRYDTAAGDLFDRDHVLRVRIYERNGIEEGHLDWKGETRYEDGYKIREEISTSVGDTKELVSMLVRLGYRPIKEIDRTIAQYSIGGATVRFEHYPRMDDLVEVEGDPAAIERAIAATGLPRDGFSTERLVDFVLRYEARTGQRAAVAYSDFARSAYHDRFTRQ